MTELVIFGAVALVAIAVIAWGGVHLSRMLADAREERMRKHLSWNGGHRAPRVAAARRS